MNKRFPMVTERGKPSRLPASYTTRFKGAPFSTNTYGFRGWEVPIKKPSGTIRIAFLGRSVTMGSGVSNEDMYTSQLQQDFNATNLEHPVEILNFAIGGGTIHKTIGYYNAYAKTFSPDVVVLPVPYGILNESIFTERLIPTPRTSQRQASRFAKQLEQHQWLNLNKLNEHLFLYRAVDVFILRNLQEWLSDDWALRDRFTVRLNKDVINEFLADMTARQQPVVILLIPHFRNLPYSDAIFEKEARAYEQLMVSYPMHTLIDIVPTVRPYLKRSNQIFLGDFHPIAEVQRAYTEAMFPEFYQLVKEFNEEHRN